MDLLNSAFQSPGQAPDFASLGVSPLASGLRENVVAPTISPLTAKAMPTQAHAGKKHFPYSAGLGIGKENPAVSSHQQVLAAPRISPPPRVLPLLCRPGFFDLRSKPALRWPREKNT